MLQYRYELCKEIAKDIATDAIKVAIQARASEDLLKSNKTISHGAEEELSLLVKQAVSLIESYQASKGGQSDNAIESARFIDACNGVNIFVNRCIGYSNTRQIIQQYFTLKNSIQERKEHQSPFHNSIQNAKTSWEQGWQFFEEYLQALSNSKSVYLCELAKKGSNASEIVITFNPSIKGFVDHIQRINMVPFFLNAGGAEEKYSILFLIGILDVFVRNAVKHGVTRNGHLSIDVEMQIGDKSHQNEYKILVSNQANGVQTNYGITKKFFDVINKLNAKNMVQNFCTENRSCPILFVIDLCLDSSDNEPEVGRLVGMEIKNQKIPSLV